MTEREEVQAQAQANREAARYGERPKSYPSPDVLRVDDVRPGRPDPVDGGGDDSPD